MTGTLRHMSTNYARFKVLHCSKTNIGYYLQPRDKGHMKKGNVLCEVVRVHYEMTPLTPHSLIRPRTGYLQLELHCGS